ncbi:hypothetical protein [Streptomyces griseorubiginosus]|nr:hypothetical protein [Streptomyces griseorubiginosus]
MAEQLTAAGHRVRVLTPLHVGAGDPPLWPCVVDAVRDDCGRCPTATSP